jgi:OHCU decarboxylase
MRLDELNALPNDDATRELLRCCGSSRWASQMAAARPFPDFQAVLAAADKIWSGVAATDWLEAFAAHPRIGETARSEWSAQEQAGAREAAGAVRARLAALNRDYEARFGYIFIICASGKTAAEMLAALERRLANSLDEERRVAAEEQRKIMRLRISKLLE